MVLTRAEINLQALRHNFDQIKQRVGSNVNIMGVVKANAYGHGIVEIAQALTKQGADYLGVGFLQEGIFLRDNGIQTPILVLGGVLGSQIKEFLNHNLDITVSSIALAERIEQEVSSNGGKKARVHLKIDTGMGRIGVHHDHALQFVEHVGKLRNLEIVGIYSHFATADERDKSFAVEQLESFQQVLQVLRERGINIPLAHIANSGAILDISDSYLNMVRPGIMLYGVYPSKEVTKTMLLKPVLSLKSKVVFIKEVPARTSISYGRTYYTSSQTKIATVPIGYGDGYSRRLTNQTEVLIKGKRYPVVGVVCMDQLMVDTGMESEIHIGDDVTLIGSDGNESISSWDIADKLGTNPYEVLTGITHRVPRVIVN